MGVAVEESVPLVPSAVATTATLGRSHGPRQPEIVSWTPRLSFSAFQTALMRSTGTSGRPRSVLPQQQPLQNRTCAERLDPGRQRRSGRRGPRSKLDPLLGLDPRLVGVLDRDDLRDDVGRLDDRRRGATAGQDDVLARVAGLEEVDDHLRVEIARAS